MPDNRFCYKISKEADMGMNTETGESVAVYTEINMQTKNVVVEGEEYDKLHKSALKGVARMLQINPIYLTPISIEEYDKNND